MWKLIWFLRDYTYDPERLSQSEVDERARRGLVGVVKIKDMVVNGHSDVPNCSFSVAFAVTVLRKRLRSPVLAPHAGIRKEPDCSGPFLWFSL